MRLLTAYLRIYQLEKNVHQSRGGDGESRPLIQTEDPEEVFSKALGVELEKICSFYVAKEGELLEEVNGLLQDILREADGETETAIRRISVDGGRLRPMSSNGTNGNLSDEDPDDSASDDDETTGLTKRKGSSIGRRKTLSAIPSHTQDMAASSEFGRSARRQSTADDYGEHSMMYSSGLFSSGIMLKKRIISLYVQLCELKSYAQLNRTGFRKVLKKFDKILDKELMSAYISAHVDPAYPFKSDTKQVIEENISKMETAYTEVVTGGDAALAKRDLRSYLREHVVWERNTVWRDLIGIERRAEAARIGQSLLGQDDNAVPKRLQGDDDKMPATTLILTPFGRMAVPSWLASTSMLTLVIAIAVFLLLLFIPIMEKPEQQNCLAMLVFVSVLWATEVSLHVMAKFPVFKANRSRLSHSS